MWLLGLVAPRHVGSSQTRTRTRVPCIGRQILNHCATREAPQVYFFKLTFITAFFLHIYIPYNSPIYFFYKFIYILFIYFWLRWVFVAVRGLSLVAVSGGATLRCARASPCGGFSCCGAWALGMCTSVVVARWLSSCGSRALERRLGSCGTQA